jgi:integrase
MAPPCGKVDREAMKKHKLTLPIPDSWEEPLERWETSMRAAGNADRTIGTRLRHMRQVARGLDPAAPDDVTGVALLEWCGQREWMPETRRNYYSSMRRFWAWRVQLTGMPNPAQSLPSVRCPPGRPRPLPENLLEGALDESAERTRLILDLAACAGLRASEICQVHIHDIFQQEDDYFLTVHGKGGVERIVPLLPWLGKWLVVTCARNGGWAFPGRIEGHLSPARVGSLVSISLPKGWTGHKARHRYATQVYRKSRDILIVQRLLGHASVATTMRYTEPDMDAVFEAISAADVHRQQ